MAGPLPVNVVLKEFLTNRGVATKNLPTGVGRLSGGDRIRTCDLEVMSLASYRAAPPRDNSSQAFVGRNESKICHSGRENRGIDRSR